MKKWVIVFPGQGSQKVGMGADIIEQEPQAKAAFERANQLLGFDILEACVNGPEELLKQTDYAQSGIFLVSACLYPLICARLGQAPYSVLGHSLGEITAYFAAGVFDLNTALGVIQTRGNAMLQACNETPSEMAAILGMELSAIQDALAPFKSAPVVAANINSPNQIVISGASFAMPAALEALKAAGAKRAIPLPVAGAFHSPMMQSAANTLAEYLKTVSFSAPEMPIVLNRTASPTSDLNELKENLPQQVVSSVRWSESISKLAQDPDVSFIECGPGAVLGGLIKKIAPEATVISIDSVSALDLLSEYVGVKNESH